MDMIDYDDLCPGIRTAVRWLHSLGYETTDSGDGSHFFDGMEGAMPEPMVAIQFPATTDLIDQANRLARRLIHAGVSDVRVDASYSPGESAIVVLSGDGLRKLPDEANPAGVGDSVARLAGAPPFSE